MLVTGDLRVELVRPGDDADVDRAVGPVGRDDDVALADLAREPKEDARPPCDRPRLIVWVRLRERGLQVLAGEADVPQVADKIPPDTDEPTLDEFRAQRVVVHTPDSHGANLGTDVAARRPTPRAPEIEDASGFNGGGSGYL